MRMNPFTTLAWDGVLSLVFFLQHSGMVRRSFQAWLGRFLPSRHHRAVYTIASGAALLLLVGCWQSSHIRILVLGGAAHWLVRIVFLLSWAGFAWGLLALGDFDVFGVEPILFHLRGTTRPQTQLTIRGPYLWVRHPLYSFIIVAIWACPVLSADRLVFNVLWTTWIVVGAKLEERDLVAEYGNAYRAYQAEVPMLVPFRGRRRAPGKASAD
jgi:protein-S-isoprenylcysteine O-methyltransferase Ste14